MKISVLILTCLASTPAELCDRATALDIREVFASPGECAVAGLSTVAADPCSAKGLRVKMICGGRQGEEPRADGRP